MRASIKKIYVNSKGSFTVEASIIFSIVFLLIATLVYLFIIMYQYCFLQSVANQAANVGAYHYVNQYGTDYTSKSNFNLYWRIIDTSSVDKKNMLNSFISKRLDQSFLNSTRYSNNTTSYKFLLKQLDISIEDQYPLPIGNLFKIFGISPTLHLKAEATSPLDDNAEFVRNLDIVIDIKNCILNSDNKWIGKDSKVNDILDKLLKKN
jgi:hypothetical protein